MKCQKQPYSRLLLTSLQRRRRLQFDPLQTHRQQQQGIQQWMVLTEH
jgi:hypothetical protein